jgi:hypothetical protein
VQEGCRTAASGEWRVTLLSTPSLCPLCAHASGESRGTLSSAHASRSCLGSVWVCGDTLV